MTNRSHQSVQRGTVHPIRRASFKTSFILVGALGVVVAASVVAVGATGGSRSPSTPTTVGHHATPTRSAHLQGRWSTPRDQVGAPTIPTPGGATEGLGGFNGVSCPTASECVAVGGDGALNGVASTSQDDGVTWTQGILDQNEPELNAVDCANESICVAVGQGVVVQSSDGGQTWTSSTIPTSNTALLGVSCPSSTTCVSVGVSPSQNGPLAGQLLVSADGGVTWSVPSLPANVGALGSVDCPTASYCVAVGSSIVISNDGGQTWTLSTVDGGTGVLRSVSCESATTCVAVGGNPAVSQGLNATAYEVVTSDGGQQWSPVPMPSGSGTVNTIACSSTACIAVGAAEQGYALQVLTTTSGLTWATDPSITNQATAFSGLSCFASTNCVFVGLDGTQQVSVSTATGNPVGTGSVSSQVRAQRDEVRR